MSVTLLNHQHRKQTNKSPISKLVIQALSHSSLYISHFLSLCSVYTRYYVKKGVQVFVCVDMYEHV